VTRLTWSIPDEREQEPPSYPAELGELLQRGDSWSNWRSNRATSSVDRG
jgi:hypothetical protein